VAPTQRDIVPTSHFTLGIRFKMPVIGALRQPHINTSCDYMSIDNSRGDFFFELFPIPLDQFR